MSTSHSNQASVALVAAKPGDFEALVALRIEAMRESLERIGRFDPLRARERFLSGFSAECTRHIEVAGERVGFIVVKPQAEGLLLDHLYVRPIFQGKGVGTAVLAHVFAQADASALSIRVGALRGSNSNRFYARHGFHLVEQDEFDNYYVRPGKMRAIPLLPLTRRPAATADLPFLLALRQRTMDVHLTASGVSTDLDTHRERLMYRFDCAEIVLADNQAVGLIKVARDAIPWEIIQIQVVPEFQGRGVGAQLLRELITQATCAKADLALSVLKANPARALYERLGFVVVGEDSHEYFMQRQA